MHPDFAERGPRRAWRTPRARRGPPFGAQQWHARRGFAVALVASLAIHFAFTLWTVETPALPDATPLQATITELPPPPQPVAAAEKPKAKAKVNRARAAPPPPRPPESATVAADEPPSLIEPTAEAIATGPEPSAVPVDVAAATPNPNEHSPDTLPARVDLVYRGFFSALGFEVGDAVYRFEHHGGEYRIRTVGKLHGLLALFFPGEAKLESRGLITSAGLQPLEFSFERTGRNRREVAEFNWETGTVALQDQQSAALELPTFDALSIMWQYYFTPPPNDEVTFSLATTRRVRQYTVTREGEERIEWGGGMIDTERWHHRSDDGRHEGYAWLAPSLHYIPVKLRYIGPRATFEGRLDSIRVDEPLAQR